MVGIMYKVLSKVLSSKLSKVTGSVVSDSQSTFVQGIHILDKILIDNKAIGDARRFKNDLLLFKVDFEKDFDSMDCKGLETLMVEMNFHTLWQKWIMVCVTIASA